MPRRPQCGEPLDTISIRVPHAIAEQMRKQGAEAVRSAVACGLAIQKDPVFFATLDLHNEANRLRQYIENMPAGTTPAGSRDCTTPAHLPAPGCLQPPEVLVLRGCGVTLAAVGGLLTIDMDGGQLEITSDAGTSWRAGIDRAALAVLVPAVAGALMAMATRPGAVRLPLGLVMERGESGAVLLQGGELSVAIDALTAYQWSAELASLLVARLRLDGCRMIDLERSLAASPDAVEVEA